LRGRLDAKERGMGPRTSDSPPPTGWSWVREELAKKANREWVESELKALSKDEDETRKIALSGKKKAEMPHACSQEETIDEIMKTINGWRTVKLGAVISVGILIAGGLAQFFALKAKADENGEAVTQIQQSIDGMEGDVEKTAKAVEDHLEWTEEQEKNKEQNQEKQLQVISDTVRVAIEQANGKKKKKR
jgi:outer membrane murein-binding lipoprotein Lpp